MDPKLNSVGYADPFKVPESWLPARTSLNVSPWSLGKVDSGPNRICVASSLTASELTAVPFTGGVNPLQPVADTNCSVKA